MIASAITVTVIAEIKLRRTPGIVVVILNASAGRSGISNDPICSRLEQAGQFFRTAIRDPSHVGRIRRSKVSDAMAGKDRQTLAIVNLAERSF
jgi:hypothetical protein